jgi:hypothetical protein
MEKKEKVSYALELFKSGIITEEQVQIAISKAFYDTGWRSPASQEPLVSKRAVEEVVSLPTSYGRVAFKARKPIKVKPFAFGNLEVSSDRLSKKKVASIILKRIKQAPKHAHNSAKLQKFVARKLGVPINHKLAVAVRNSLQLLKRKGEITNSGKLGKLWALVGQRIVGKGKAKFNARKHRNPHAPFPKQNTWLSAATKREALLSILKATYKPMSVQELAEAFRHRFPQLEGERAVNAVHNVLTLDKTISNKVKRVKEGVYAFNRVEDTPPVSVMEANKHSTKGEVQFEKGTFKNFE